MPAKYFNDKIASDTAKYSFLGIIFCHHVINIILTFVYFHSHPSFFCNFPIDFSPKLADIRFFYYFCTLTKHKNLPIIKYISVSKYALLNMNPNFEIRDCNNNEIAKELIREYSTIKGAEQCFVSLNNELADLDSFYKGGALLIGFEDNIPIATIAIRKIDESTCEIKRLYIKPDYRGKGYARILIESILDRAKRLGFSYAHLTTKPAVMGIAYQLYKNLGFEELENIEGTASMKKRL